MQINKNKSILVFSKYIHSNYGGAELSMISLSKKTINKFGTKFKFLGLENPNFMNAQRIKNELLENHKKEYFRESFQIKNFPLWDYLINRYALKKNARKRKEETLWTYGVWAPNFANNFEGEVFYFVRSESDLGIFKNYNYGMRRFFKFIHIFIEAIPLLIYRNDLKTTFRKSIIISNSEFMAKQVKKIFNVESKVIYPEINVSKILNSEKFKKSKKDSILFIGDSNVKGLSLILKLTKYFYKENFIIYTRRISSEKKVDNIVFKPWASSSFEIYNQAKLVLVPSQWQEAYGRVSREAFLLKINLLVSNVGGLPETVNFNSKYLIDDFKNINAWKSRILKVLNGKNY